MEGFLCKVKMSPWLGDIIKSHHKSLAHWKSARDSFISFFFFFFFFFLESSITQKSSNEEGETGVRREREGEREREAGRQAGRQTDRKTDMEIDCFSYMQMLCTD